MVNTPKNKPSLDEGLSTESGDSVTAFLLSSVQQFYSREGRLAIAVSGGVDSMALLHAAWRVTQQSTHQPRLFALHVHHGLQNEADEWQGFVREFCELHGIGFDVARLDANTRQNAQSIEDWARQGRYAALAAIAKQHDITHIWLAQHEDDQIETHLLQKSRGAGARGQAAMPAEFEQAGLTWQRPWLNVSRTQIERYAAHHQLQHIVDPSNTNPRFARNALRLTHHAEPLNDIARHRVLSDIQAAQQQLQQESAWAESILAKHIKAPNESIGERSSLKSLKLNEFSSEQQALLMRHWLAQMGVRMPSRAAMRELLKQINNPRIDQQMCWQHPDGLMISRFRDELIAAYHIEQPLSGEVLQLPAFANRYGVDVKELEQFGLKVKMRQGGERIRLHPRRPSMDLKKAYLEAGIAPMLRGHLPLIYCNGRLVYAAGLGMNVDACALGGVPLQWHIKLKC